MKLLDNILYIEFKDFIAAGWKENTVWTANKRNGSNWQMVKNPADRRCPMVQYESMIAAHKEKIQLWLRKSHQCKHDNNACNCGNPYDYVAKNPIRKLVVMDAKAEKFYLSYRYDGEKALSTEHCNKYITAANWLNMLNEMNANKKFIKKELNLSLESFFKHIAEIITTDNIDLPGTYQRLRQRMDQYKAEGYGCLITGKFGNKSAAKIIENDSSSDVLLTFIEHPNQYDDVMVAYLYNQWASKNGYKMINPASVGVWRRKKADEITIGREGSGEFNERFIRQVKGLKPRLPLQLTECDDYNLNYYYINPDMKKDEGSKELQRYVSYIIVDSAFDLVLGKSYRQALAPTFDMIKLAWIDAMYYIRNLTQENGEKQWYAPFEIKADGWNKNVCHPYFKKIANFVPAAHANKHRGYIEDIFGSPHCKRAEKLAAHTELNYNGNNITTVNKGVNVEALYNNSKSRPLIGDEAEQQVEKFFHFMQKMPAITRNNMMANSREQQWLESWKTLTPEQKKPISDEQFLLKFGFVHEPQGRQITITNRGVEPQINNRKYSYDLPDSNMLLKYNGAKVNVIYDPYDMSRVLVTNGDDIRFMAQSATLQPRALSDAGIGTRAALNMVLSEKKEQVKTVGDKASARQKRVSYETIDVESVMLGGMMPKELKNSIEQVFLEEGDRRHTNALDQM